MTLVLQFVLVSITFPLTELWTNTPLFHIDGAYHWYEMKLAVNLAATGKVVGYDPFFAAGHPDGIVYNFSAKLPALLATLFSSEISEIKVYKLYAFFAACLSPLAIPGAAMIFRCPPSGVFWAAIFGLFMWWVSYFHWYLTAGMVGYVMSCYLGIFFVSLLVQYLEGKGAAWAAFGIGIMGAVGFFVHPVFPIAVAFSVSAYLVTNFAHVQRNRLPAAMVVVPVISLVPNIIWILPTYSYQKIYPLDVDQPYQQVVDGSLIWRELIGSFQDGAHGSKVYLVLLTGVVWACIARGRSNRRRISIAFLMAAIALELFAHLGSAIPSIGKLTQPNRFAPAGYLLLCVPAAIGLCSMMGALRGRSWSLLRVFASVNFAGVIGASCFLAYEIAQQVLPGPHGRYGAAPPHVRPLGPDTYWLTDWLRRHTTTDARVLFETSVGRVHDQAHMAAYYAYTVEREFIGGPYPYMHFSSFWDDWAFGRKLAEISFLRMKEYLSLYNVGSIIVHSDAAKRYFDMMPGVAVSSEHGRLKAYLVRERSTYFLLGAGQIEKRGHNNLQLAGVSGKEIVLKYHYVPGMIGDPSVQIDGVRVLNDPHLFVRIVNPPPRFRLFLP